MRSEKASEETKKLLEKLKIKLTFYSFLNRIKLNMVPIKVATILFILSIFLHPSDLLSYEDSRERRLNLWPILVYKQDKEENQEFLEILGPFIYKYETPNEKGFSVRPLLSTVRTNEEKKAFFLSPLGIYREDNETETFKLIPLIRRRAEKEGSEEGQLRQSEFFPIFWGRTSTNETYWGIFPIYGKLKERFGREEITFVFWPFYSRVVYEDHIATNILWPFIRFTHAKESEHKDRYTGFKIWPLYGHFREGEEERKFILWPFYIRSNYSDELNNFEDKLYIFPFYLREKTDTYERRIYLWPFIQIVTAQDPQYRQIDAPWPFYRKISGEAIEGRRIFPLYGYIKKNNSFESFLLWPFYFYSEYSDNSSYFYFEKKHRFLLLSKYVTIYENDTLTFKEFRLWPLLYSYNNTKKNISTLYLPAILPLIDEGIERNYSPLLKIYENFKYENTEITKALWGLYRRERKGNRQVLEVSFLVRRVCDEKTNYIEFFEGLLGFGKIEGKSVLKIFFIDWRNIKN